MIATTYNLYKKAYSGLTHRIWLLALVMFINRSGTMVLAFMTLYCRHLGYSMQQAGLVVAIYGIGSVAGALLGGKLSDRFGFYNIQFLALLCGGLMFILLGQMQSYLAICICTFILAMVNESFRPANATAIAYYSTPENRTQSFSLIRLAINLGWGIGSALGGILASVNYHLLFWTDGVTNMVASFLLLLILPRVSMVQQKTLSKKQQAGAAPVRSPLKDRIFIYFLFFQIIFSICFFQLFTTVPLFFKEGLHLSEHNIGLIMSANGIIIALFEMVIVYKLEGRFDYLFLMTAGVLLMGLSFLALNLPLASAMLVGIFSMVIITISEMISMPFMNTWYIARSNEQNRGSYAGLYTMAWSIAQVVGSSGGAMVANKIGFHNLWIWIFSISVFAAAGYFWLWKVKEA